MDEGRKKILKWLAVECFACASHARRPFKNYAHENPDNCAHILHLFRMIFFYEKGIDLFGRNVENTLAARNADSRPVWEEIREVAKRITRKMSGSTMVGHGARYIERNYEKLTAYLDDARVAASNKFSEGQLRPEKQIQGASLFRFSLNGRFALDVNRSVSVGDRGTRPLEGVR